MGHLELPISTQLEGLTVLCSGHENQYLGTSVFLAPPSTSPTAEQCASHFKVF